ncbi:hypothetical protein GCM10023315_06160 [Algibacter aquimarinus]|uniref:Transposase n=1 Tax=Algibacter aquimarinus TaxID=1136748 RepID=A0ABP9H6H8_9FLAO
MHVLVKQLHYNQIKGILKYLRLALGDFNSCFNKQLTFYSIKKEAKQPLFLKYILDVFLNFSASTST